MFPSADSKKALGEELLTAQRQAARKVNGKKQATAPTVMRVLWSPPSQQATLGYHKTVDLQRGLLRRGHLRRGQTFSARVPLHKTSSQTLPALKKLHYHDWPGPSANMRREFFA